MTQNPEDIQRQIAELEAQLAALKSQTAPTTPNTNEGSLAIYDSETPGVNAGVMMQSTVNQFFGDKPPKNGEQLLQDYLQALIADCNRLRLDRMVEKRQTGAEQATTPTLKLEDVYTNLVTDGPWIVLDEQTDTFVELEQLYDEEYFKEKTLDNCDPSEVQYLVYEDKNREVVTASQIRRLDNDDDPHDYTLRLEHPELAFDAICQERRLVLLGEPCSGKSSVLRYLAVLLARKLRGEEVFIPGWEEVDTLPVPILCPLGQVAQALTETGDADEALWRTLGTVLEGAQPLRAGLRKYLEDAINRGDVILLCDGLDELPLESSSDEPIEPRRDIARAIQKLAYTAPHIRIVLTSRVRPYQDSSAWQMSHEEGWQVRTIQPLAFGQVRTFIQSWYHALIDKADLASADDADARSRHLIAEIERHPRIRPLTESPLLLTMLTILHYNTDTISLDRATLYHECVQLLLERWEPVRSSNNRVDDRTLLTRLGDIPGLSLERLRIVLHDLAFEAHKQPPTDDGRGLIDGEKLDGKMHRFFVSLHCNNVEEKIQIFREVLETEAGLLQVPDHDRYAFPHLTFQEYLAACYLVDRIGKDQRSLAYEHWCSPDVERWREVLLLMMGRLRHKGIPDVERDGTDWLEYLLERKVQGKRKSGYQRQRDLVLAALSYAEIDGWTTLANWDMDVKEKIEVPLYKGLRDLLRKPNQYLSFADRVAAATALGQIGDSRFPVAISDWQGTFKSLPKTFGKLSGYWCYISDTMYTVGRKEYGFATIGLNEFWIARFLITVAQFRLFVEVGYSAGAERWWTPHGWQWKQQTQRTAPLHWDAPTWQGRNQPVIGVTWYEAVAFVNWLDEQLASVLPDGYQLRLPTEAEWEVAAAYDGTGNRRTYPWGEDAPTIAHAVFEESKLGRTAPIGCCPDGRAACGALDMAGNVWEWTCSHTRGYPETSDRVMKDLAVEKFFIPVRGGSWWTGDADIHCEARQDYRPDGCLSDGPGFRIVVARRDDGA